MQGLLSKEVLGPSLEDFVKRLPEYIEKNKETLDKKDIDRYESQKKLMEEVLEELNKEQESDSEDIKKERFSKVLALMQKVGIILQEVWVHWGMPSIFFSLFFLASRLRTTSRRTGGGFRSPFQFRSARKPVELTQPIARQLWL